MSSAASRRGTARLLLAFSLISAACGVSQDSRGLIDKSLDEFVARWKTGAPEDILADLPQNKDTPRDLIHERATRISGLWGSLKSAKLTEIKRLVIGTNIYIADAVMDYDHGRTSGRFVFEVRGGTANLLTATPADAPTD